MYKPCRPLGSRSKSILCNKGTSQTIPASANAQAHTPTLHSNKPVQTIPLTTVVSFQSKQLGHPFVSEVADIVNQDLTGIFVGYGYNIFMSKSPVEKPPGTVDLNTMMVLTDLAGKIANTEALIEVFTNKIHSEMEMMESRLNKRIDDVARQMHPPGICTSNKIHREMEMMESRLNQRIDDVAHNIMSKKKGGRQLTVKEVSDQRCARMTVDEMRQQLWKSI